MNKNIKQKALTNLLEKYSGKKVILKEENYYENKYFQRAIERVKIDIGRTLREFQEEVKDLGPEVSGDQNLKDCENYLKLALNSITFN